MNTKWRLALVVLAAGAGGLTTIAARPTAPGADVVTHATGLTDPAGSPRRAPVPARKPPAAPVSRRTPAAVTSVPTPRPSVPPAQYLPTVPTMTWTASNCYLMIRALEWDHELDVKAETDYPDNADYYTLWASRWRTALDLMESGPCATPATRLGGVQCTDPEAWFATAIAVHVTDAENHPESAAWDTKWKNIYTNLATLWPTSEGC